MAARQDQGLQIALIILIFLFILSAVAAYIGWKSYGESQQRVEEQTRQLGEKDKQVNNYQTENESLREWIGVGPNDNFDSVKAAYEADMKRYGGVIGDETRRFYKTVLEAVAKERDDAAARDSESKKNYKDLEAKYEAREGETDKQIAEFKAANKKLEEDNASERRKFNDHIAQMDETKKNLMASLDTQRTELEGKIAERDTNVKGLEARVAELGRANSILQEQVPKDEESFEVADGRVTWVNQNGTVWIDVGSADAIRRQVTFNVYDADEHDADRAIKKGSIEVTRIMGDHSAEARITQDNPTNPILTGDNIYSPVWHRGKKLRFALTGVIDFNNDGVSDLKLARELIELNGGAVDAYLGDDAKIEGEITPHTRYLVLGEFPTSAVRAGMQEGWNKMTAKAKELGVETITLEQFLNRMGYTPQDRTVRLGEGASAHDFPARSGGENQVPDAEPQLDEKSSKFRERTPYGMSRKTPY